MKILRVVFDAVMNLFYDILKFFSQLIYLFFIIAYGVLIGATFYYSITALLIIYNLWKGNLEFDLEIAKHLLIAVSCFITTALFRYYSK